MGGRLIMFRIIADKKPQSILMERNTDGTYKITYKGVAVYSSVENKMLSDVTVIIHRAKLINTTDISIAKNGDIKPIFLPYEEWALPIYEIQQVYQDYDIESTIDIIVEY